MSTPSVFLRKLLVESSWKTFRDKLHFKKNYHGLVWIIQVFSRENSRKKYLDDAYDRNWTLIIIIRTWCEYTKCFPGKIPVESTWRTFAAELHLKNNYQGLCWVFQVFSREIPGRKHLDDAYDKVPGEYLELSYTVEIIIKTCAGYSKCLPGKTPIENTWITLTTGIGLQ
ncbi:hypothetical protein KQX54_012752 [Cotesia glomerata]|uniref:Uncharacterized protein n=1 Tax=Cotesia glomerata TaxID=32391 RepID=A0AAV7IB89_COTGL|nr:hypothetical protein KQX54_000487 [Cotesia glomerata]KAH0561087.1 hypothetical protein KQX54_012752 [Cotesia glomerata]